MDAPLIRLHRHEQVATLIFNRPEKRNALSRELLSELARMLDDLHLERSVRAVVLTGAGPAFSAGMDLDEMRTTASEPDALARWSLDAESYRDLLEKMLLFPKPLVAAVNGPALAGGAGLVLACDLVVAAHGARFGLPEPLRGLSAAVVAPLLVFRVGGGMAAYLLLSSQSIDAAEAHRTGLFHELVAPDELWPRAFELGTLCARGAPESLQMTKRMLNETIGEALASQLSAGAAVSATARTTEAADEGVRAFLEKRPPQWK